MSIDTIFLCFCEDSERNDGITKPYYMSKGLTEFVANSSKALAALKTRHEADKSSKGKSTLQYNAHQNNSWMSQVA